MQIKFWEEYYCFKNKIYSKIGGEGGYSRGLQHLPQLHPNPPAANFASQVPKSSRENQHPNYIPVLSPVWIYAR